MIDQCLNGHLLAAVENTTPHRNISLGVCVTIVPAPHTRRMGERQRGQGSVDKPQPPPHPPPPQLTCARLGVWRIYTLCAAWEVCQYIHVWRQVIFTPPAWQPAALCVVKGVSLCVLLHLLHPLLHIGTRMNHTVISFSAWDWKRGQL